MIDELPAPAPAPRLRGVVERELRGGRRREVCSARILCTASRSSVVGYLSILWSELGVLTTWQRACIVSQKLASGFVMLRKPF